MDWPVDYRGVWTDWSVYSRGVWTVEEWTDRSVDWPVDSRGVWTDWSVDIQECGQTGV